MFVSIVGDSISTYHGFNPEGYSVYYDAPTSRALGLSSVYDTWWAQVNVFLRAYLCVSNAYSGSRVTGSGFPSASSPERTAALHNGQQNPDLILIYMGINDLGNGIAPQGNDPDCFVHAYERMLAGIRKQYPRAWIFCGTLMKGYIKNRLSWELPELFSDARFEEYNQAIRTACRRQQCVLADLAAQKIPYETLDGVHPTVQGHKTIAKCWISSLKRD